MKGKIYFKQAFGSATKTIPQINKIDALNKPAGKAKPKQLKFWSTLPLQLIVTGATCPREFWHH